MVTKFHGNPSRVLMSYKVQRIPKWHHVWGYNDKKDKKFSKPLFGILDLSDFPDVN